MKTFPHDQRYVLLTGLLRTLREEAGLRQTQVAARLGKPQSYVSKYEIGERRLDPVELYMICEVLGISFTGFAKRYDAELARLDLQ